MARVNAETLALLVVGALLFSAGCKKEEETAAPADAAPAPTASGTVEPVPMGDVATYAAMVPEKGTRRLLQPLTAHQAADAASKELAKLDAGTVITFKASYGDWKLVSWQSGAGALSLGWVGLKSNDSRAAVVPDSAAAAPAAVADAGTGTKPADAGAAPADAGTAPADAGAAPADAGAAPADAGAAAPADAGSAAPADAGAAPADAGAGDGGPKVPKRIFRLGGSSGSK